MGWLSIMGPNRGADTDTRLERRALDQSACANCANGAAALPRQSTANLYQRQPELSLSGGCELAERAGVGDRHPQLLPVPPSLRLRVAAECVEHLCQGPVAQR